MRITKKTLDLLRSDHAKGEWFPDDEVPGFFVVVYASGKKTFFVRYRSSTGGRRTVRIGAYGVWTIEKARGEAKHFLSQADLGGDPAAERDEARRKPTWGEWVDRYVARVALQKRSPREDRRFLGLVERGARPSRYASLRRRWRDRAIDSITREEVEAFRTEIAKAGHPTAANRWLASFRACINVALRSGLVAYNVASHMRHFLEAPPRARTLTSDETAALLKSLEREPDSFAAAAVRIMLETGCRKSEILRAKWEDIDFDGDPVLWRIPSPKTGRPQVVPLATSTVALLRRLPRMGPFIIAGRRIGEPRKTIDHTWRAILERANLADKGIRAHDLRRTFGLLVARDAGLHVASKLLRHASVTVTEQVYAPLGLKELGAAMERRSTVLAFPEKAKAS